MDKNDYRSDKFCFSNKGPKIAGFGIDFVHNVVVHVNILILDDIVLGTSQTISIKK